MLFFLAIALFVGFWAWYFVATLSAGQYHWAFGSLLLFALSLFASAVMGRAQSMAINFAWAKLFVTFGTEGAEALLDRVKALIPAEARKVLEEAKPQLVEEARREFETAATLAVATTSTFPTSGIPPSGALSWSDFPTITAEDLDDLRKHEWFQAAVRRRIRRRPTDQSSGSAR